MPPLHKSLSLLTFSILAAGCATREENVIFVTKTSLGIDFEPSTSSAAIAYDRIEGYSTPRFAKNYIPPVYANFDHSGGSLFNPKIKQIYATGNAAKVIAEGGQPERPQVTKVLFQPVALSPVADTLNSTTLPSVENKPMFFGTSTIFGLKMGFSQTALDGFSLGYKRKEISVIPKKDNAQEFPSVLASIDTGTETGNSAKTTRAEIKQFFATGTAADSLATDQWIQEAFRSRTQSTLAAFYENERVQKSAAMVSIACIMQVADTALPKVWVDAEVQGLISKEAHAVLQQRSPQDARRQYVIAMYDVDHTNKDNTPRLREHKAFVCGMAQR